MSDGFDSLQLVGRHVPDASTEKGPDGQPFSVPLPGNYEVGVEVAGQFLPLGVFKAGNFLNADGSPINPPASSSSPTPPPADTTSEGGPTG